jgi:hypothetical protein
MLPPIPRLWKYIGAVVVGLALIAAIVGGVRSCKKIDQQNQNTTMNAGADKVLVQQQAETINAVQKAQDTVKHPSAEQLNSVCSKYDRNCAHHGS